MEKMIKKPFVRYNEEKTNDAFTVRLNKEERILLNDCKIILEQKKDSTALKQLAWFGAKTLQDDKMKYIIQELFKNKRKNTRLGIIDFS